MRRVAIFLDRWRWGLLALAAPFLLFPSPARTPALLVVPCTWLIAKLAGRKPLPRTPLNGALLLLSLMVLVSLFATYDLAVSLPKVAGMVLGVGVFYAGVVHAERSRSALGEMIGVYLGLGMAMAGLGLLTTHLPGKLKFLAPLISHLPARLVNLPGADTGVNPNEIAGVLLWVAPLAIALAVFFLLPSSLPGVLLILAALITSGVLILTQSRSGLIGLGVAVLAMFLLVSRRRVRWITLALVLILGLAGALALARMGKEGLGQTLLGSSLSAEQDATVNSLEGRVEIWSRAIYGIQDFPFTGMGMNTFRQVVHVLYPLFLISPDKDIAHAHNTWLQTALDLGLPGLVAHLAIWMVTVVMLLQVLRRTGDMWLRTVSIGLLGSLAGYFVYGLTDTVALGARPGFLWWMLLGLVVGLYNQVEGSKEQGPISKSQLPTPDSTFRAAGYNQ